MSGSASGPNSYRLRRRSRDDGGPMLRRRSTWPRRHPQPRTTPDPTWNALA